MKRLNMWNLSTLHLFFMFLRFTSYIHQESITSEGLYTSILQIHMSKLEAGSTNSHATLCTSFLPFCNKHSHPHTHTYRHLTPVPFALVLSAEPPISHTQICPKIYDRLLNLYFESYMQCHRGTCRTKGAKI